MSEKFGLDWPKYNFSRMTEFMLILHLRAKIKEDNAKKQSNSTKHGRS